MRKPGVNSRGQLEQHGIDHQAEQAQCEKRDGEGDEAQDGPEREIDEANHHRGQQRGAVAADLDPGNDLRDQP